MSEITKEDVLEKLGNLSILEVIALTKHLEEKWDVKGVPPVQIVQQAKQDQSKVEEQTEFTAILKSFEPDKKMGVIKVIRELLGLGLKESKDLVEAAPKMLKEYLSKEDVDSLKSKLESAGAVIEVK